VIKVRLDRIDNKDYCILIVIVIAFFSFFSSRVIAKDNILVLHSAHQNHAPAEDIQQGIEAVFTESNSNLYV